LHFVLREELKGPHVYLESIDYRELLVEISLDAAHEVGTEEPVSHLREHNDLVKCHRFEFSLMVVAVLKEELESLRVTILYHEAVSLLELDYKLNF
jgi:hypothetical protein